MSNHPEKKTCFLFPIPMSQFPLDYFNASFPFLVPELLRRSAGYGGDSMSFARTDFNDLYALDLDTWQWEQLECAAGLPLPEARSSAQLVFVPGVVPPNEPATHSRLYMSGGWNAMQQFGDVWSLDLETMAWVEVESATGEKWSSERWEHSMVAVRCVPHWKVFCFGGKSGDLSYETGIPTGNFNNDLLVLETGSAMPDTWVSPEVEGDLPPARADSPVTFDPGTSSLVMFGGWSSRWLGDLWVCRVRDVVGPPYSIYDNAPKIGAVTGGTSITVRGMGLADTKGDVNVSVACAKGALEVPGEVLSDTEMQFITPDYRQFGQAQDVQCRLKISSLGLTNTAIGLKLFEVTDAKESLVFGPGILNNCAAGAPVNLVIQAKDKHGNDRWCGMDEFVISVVRTMSKEEVKEGVVDDPVDVAIVDSGDGTYVATYTLPKSGEYTVSVKFEGTFQGEAGHCYGSPFVFKAKQSKELAAKVVGEFQATEDALAKVTAAAKLKWQEAKEKADADVTDDKAANAEIELKTKLEKAEAASAEAATKLAAAKEEAATAVDKEVNEIDGPLALEALRVSIKNTKNFSTTTLGQLKEANPKDDLEPLVRVKRSVAALEDGRAARELALASDRAALRYLRRGEAAKKLSKDKTKDAERMAKELEVAQEAWDVTKKELPLTVRRITASNNKWTDNVEASVESFTKDMENRTFEYKKRKMWSFDVGVAEADKDMGMADYWLTQQREDLRKNAELCALFEFPALIKPATEMVDTMFARQADMRKLWAIAKDTEEFIMSAKKLKWVEMNVDDLEDGSKRIMKGIKSINKDVRWSNAFTELDKAGKAFMNTVPLIQNLGNKAVRPRHWDMIMTVTHKKFVPPHENHDMLLEEIVALNLHEHTADVDEVCDQALKEDKMEKQLVELNKRYSTLKWGMDPYKSDASVPMLKMDGDEFEALEADQVSV